MKRNLHQHCEMSDLNPDPPQAREMSYYAGGEQITNPYGDVGGYEPPAPDSILTTISNTLSSISKSTSVGALLLAAGGTAAVAWCEPHLPAKRREVSPFVVRGLIKPRDATPSCLRSWGCMAAAFQ